VQQFFKKMFIFYHSIVIELSIIGLLLGYCCYRSAERCVNCVRPENVFEGL